jgi:predicted DCC family thiol-disulfide oxidoreductase YuxK
VDLLIRLDKKSKFKFCALQSERGRSFLKKIGREEDDISSVVYIKKLEPFEVYFKSDAALKVAEELGIGYAILSLASRTIIPFPFIRDSIYDMVANNRYNLMGKRQTCRCEDPDSAISNKFLS